MSREIDREEIMRIAAERMRLKKEKEAQEEKAFYERITSGWQWLLFKVIVAFCTLMFVVSIVETFVDGPTKKLTENDWKIDRNWEYTWHKVLDVKGYTFMPELTHWNDRKENGLSLTYSPIFRTGKRLNYIVVEDGGTTRIQSEIRDFSIFTWFPFFQILLLIPLATFIFKRQAPWFNFARIASMIIVFPGTLLVIILTML